MIILLTFGTFWWTFFIFHLPYDMDLVLVVISVRIIASVLFFEDYTLSWSRSSSKTFLSKSLLYIFAFMVYMPFYYQVVDFSFMFSELLTYLFILNLMVYFYYYLINRSDIKKTKSVVIYGCGKSRGKT